MIKFLELPSLCYRNFISYMKMIIIIKTCLRMIIFQKFFDFEIKFVTEVRDNLNKHFSSSNDIDVVCYKLRGGLAKKIGPGIIRPNH